MNEAACCKARKILEMLNWERSCIQRAGQHAQSIKATNVNGPGVCGGRRVGSVRPKKSRKFPKDGLVVRNETLYHMIHPFAGFLRRK